MINLLIDKSLSAGSRLPWLASLNLYNWLVDCSFACKPYNQNPCTASKGETQQKASKDKLHQETFPCLIARPEPQHQCWCPVFHGSSWSWKSWRQLYGLPIFVLSLNLMTTKTSTRLRKERMKKPLQSNGSSQTTETISVDVTGTVKIKPSFSTVPLSGGSCAHINTFFHVTAPWFDIICASSSFLGYPIFFILSALLRDLLEEKPTTN